jgi:hypothetical protein
VLTLVAMGAAMAAATVAWAVGTAVAAALADGAETAGAAVLFIQKILSRGTGTFNQNIFFITNRPTLKIKCIKLSIFTMLMPIR